MDNEQCGGLWGAKRMKVKMYCYLDALEDLVAIAGAASSAWTPVWMTAAIERRSDN